MILISLVSTYYERDIAMRTYLISKNDFQSGEYKKKFKTIEDVLENRINSNEYDYTTYTQKLYWDVSIVFFVILLFLLKKITTKSQVATGIHMRD